MLGILAKKPSISDALSGNIRSYSGMLPNAITGTKLDPSNNYGYLASFTGTAGVYLFISGYTTTPYIKASLYNSTTRTRTPLTIAGALDENLSVGAYASLTYSDEQDKFYLLGGGTAALKVYPLTLSGTTLTIEADIDLSASFTGDGNDVLMTGDRTDLFLFDTADGAFKKYDLSAGSLGAALDVPAAEYYVGDNLRASLWYSDGNIYFISAGTDDVWNKTFQKYSITGNTWSSLTVPLYLQGMPAKDLCVIADDADDTYFYFWNGVNAAVEPYLTRYTVATAALDFIVGGQTQKTSLFNYSGVPQFGAIIGSGYSATYPYSGKRAGVLDISKNDIMALNGVTFDVLNFGENYGMATLADYTGAGSFLGVCVPYKTGTYAYGSSTLVSGDCVFEVTIDGGTPRLLHLRDFFAHELFRTVKIPFATSIVIKGMAGNKNPLYNILLNITS